MTHKAKLTVGIIIDESGSMNGQQSAVVGGYNEYLQSLRKRKDADIRVSLIKFSDDPAMIHDAVGLENVPDMGNDSYQPNGSTALLDAVGAMITSLDAITDESVLMVIMTDGQENASKTFKRAQINLMIEDRKKKGWTFIYTGSDLSVEQEAASVGLRGQSLMYAATTEGTKSRFDDMTVGTQALIDHEIKTSGKLTRGDIAYLDAVRRHRKDKKESK